MLYKKIGLMKFGLICCALVLAFAHSAEARTTSQAAACRYIDGWRGTNVPIAPGISATDIVRAVAVSKDGTSVGWFVGRRDGQIWYFDGPVRGPRPPEDLSVKFLDLTGNTAATKHLNALGHGAMIVQKHPIDLRSIVNAGFELQTCY